MDTFSTFYTQTIGEAVVVSPVKEGDHQWETRITGVGKTKEVYYVKTTKDIFHYDGDPSVLDEYRYQPISQGDFLSALLRTPNITTKEINNAKEAIGVQVQKEMSPEERIAAAKQGQAIAVQQGIEQQERSEGEKKERAIAQRQFEARGDDWDIPEGLRDVIEPSLHSDINDQINNSIHLASGIRAAGTGSESRLPILNKR